MQTPKAITKLLETSEKTRISRGFSRTTFEQGEIWCDMSSNDYLSLSKDARVIAAAQQAVQEYGTSARASRLVGGSFPVHHALERALAELVGQESGLVFSSGYAANIGVIAAFGRQGAELFLDAHVHASIHDAAALSKAKITIFEHQNTADLTVKLSESTANNKIIVVEGVYSVLGDAADLTAMHSIAEQFDALLLIDEAHSVGVLGNGRGAAVSHSLAGSKRCVITGSLGKALASQGGFVCASADIRDYLVNTARMFIFDTALAPVNAAAALRACEIIQADGESLAKNLRINAQIICETLGIEPAAGAVQSLPYLPGAEKAMALVAKLRKQGIGVGCFRPPAVPDGVTRLRFTAHAGTDTKDLRRALESVVAQLNDQ